MNSNIKVFDTNEQKLKFLRKAGNIVTFKEPFYPNGTAHESRTQTIVSRLVKARSGAVKIEGHFHDSIWYDNEDALLEAVDWDWIERAFSFSSYNNY